MDKCKTCGSPMEADANVCSCDSKTCSKCCSCDEGCGCGCKEEHCCGGCGK